MHILGRIKPKAIARIVRKAVSPSAATWTKRSVGACEPSVTSSIIPPAIRNRIMPGISGATEAKAIPAKGSRSRLAIGVMTAPTTKQPIKAPLSTLAPATEIATQRKALRRPCSCPPPWAPRRWSCHASRRHLQFARSVRPSVERHWLESPALRQAPLLPLLLFLWTGRSRTEASRWSIADRGLPPGPAFFPRGRRNEADRQWRRS